MIYTDIKKVIDVLKIEIISEERKTVLQPLIDFIQVWAQTMASYFNLKNVFCYSGGTEATALFPMVAETLINYGFNIKTISEGKNPIYAIKYSENEHPVIGFSKTYDDTFNPKAFDNTPQQTEKYNERSIQIATELFYVFSQIKS